MRLLLLLLAASTALAAEWDAVQRIPTDRKIEVTTLKGVRISAEFVSAAGDILVLRGKSGERSLPRSEIRRLRVHDPGRRIRRGLLWMAVCAGAGAAVGAASCPSCPNEGHGYKFVGPGVAIGAGVGAVGFLSSAYRTVYKGK
jgi:hypothetical protein